MSGELTDKQLSFVEYYVASHNATQAAMKAGYSPDTAYAIGHQNLRNLRSALQLPSARTTSPTSWA